MSQIEDARVFIRAHPKPFKVLVWLALLAVIAFFIIRCSSTDFEDRQRERDAEIEKLNEEIQRQKERANVTEAQVKILEENQRLLIEQGQQLRESIAQIRNERVIIRERYAAKEKDIDKISDAGELRRNNCLERERLGFPCPK